MGRKCVQLLVLLTFMVAVTKCAVPNTTVTSATATTTTSRNTTDSAISVNPTTLPSPDHFATGFNYDVRDPETGVACVRVAMAMSIKANYISTGYDIKEAFLNIPRTAKVRGTCRGVAPTMELIWAEDPTLEGTLNRITLMISRRHITLSLHVIAYELYIDNKTFPDALQEGKRFRCELRGDEHRCEPETTAGTVDVHITFPGFVLVAFNSEESVATRTEVNGVSGADVAQWSGYLLLAAKIFIFRKLGYYV
ncbi:uncharacterized protein LOC143373007 isoform X2 [Andrena cerasifolii]|uniref:uncharacterized protein LOC143373007 isoform X2 n=1 Tax=Andrena cerasifolii TaxID=2819439 RepID=UPI0040382044